MQSVELQYLKDQTKSKAELIDELRTLRLRVTHLEERAATTPQISKENIDLDWPIAPQQNSIDEIFIEHLGTILDEQSVQLDNYQAELKQIAYSLSHDLHEPIRIILCYLDLLQQRHGEQIPIEAIKFMEYVCESAQSLKALVQDLHTYVNFETHPQSFTLVDCEQVIQQTIKCMQTTVNDSGAVITYESLPTIIGNEVQLKQLFKGLISNSIKFRSKEVPRIHIAAQREHKSWLFTVQDNGIGIAPKQADRIFIIFQRLHPPGKYPGTGLGLALCKKIIEGHSGRIWLKPDTHQGTTINFTIPFMPKITRSQNKKS